ncbi:phospho-sugar mutase [Mycolicibacterium sp.]|uniref:phospho-sugar mutase n=1 Tax=Mycolicibacterium sp. TaxID=2320850 RepID=UPI0028B0556A|nr:phospho-sugar mutase [Mycolicibacterium sp.]
MSLDTSLLDTARAWLAEDPDPATAEELSALIARAEAGDAEAATELADAFDGTLQFGTAGLRGRLGPGSNRMNRVVVARAAAGLAAYLVAHGGNSLVIGYDARRNSDVFARDTARIMAGAGITALVLPTALPTPVLAFAVRELGCAAGVMVTASHNPPDDNGYKVYLGDGSQIVPPADSEISACIAAVGPMASIAQSDDYRTLDGAVLDAYVARAVSLLGNGSRAVSAVYTAMHGVGGEVFMRAVRDAGFDAPTAVAAQFAPDGRFPTVNFPNPEEPGAMDLSLADARAQDADVIIANDPDADRCAAGVRAGDDYRMLTGDEVGALLGWWIAERGRRDGAPATGVYAQSIVSGTLLERIATDAGLGYATTLTGFKWISKVPNLRFGYEEALGYCCDPTAVKDKDGITASLLMLEMVAALKAEGRSVQDVLDDVARKHGLYATSQLSVRVSDLSLISDAMARLRANPPAVLGGRDVIAMDDLEQGVDGLPPTDGVRFALRDARVIVRPSGTEPKLKCYLQVVVPVVGDIVAARAGAQTELGALRASVAEAVGL